jgi:hypothetical protein
VSVPFPPLCALETLLIGEQDFYLDLPFSHPTVRCF